jgi:glycosyltransferase involved in cell wall biosynthesis
MIKITYVLHHFPGITDTFIRREIRSLQKLGIKVDVISVWRPRALQTGFDVVSRWATETTHDILSDWTKETHFILPTSIAQILLVLFTSAVRHPIRFSVTLYLAFSTARPGIRGLLYQLIYFVQAVLVARVLRQKSTDHVHNHIGDVGGTVTMLAANLAGIGYSITFHGWPVFFDAKYSRIKEKVLRAQFTRSISYFCRSQLMMFSESEDPTSFKVVRCGLDIGQYSYRGPSEQVKRLFCSGRLAPEKGHVFLLKALRLLLDQGHELELRFAGNGPSKERLEGLVHQLGLDRQVQFLGFLNEDQIMSELRNSDLFVLPSFVEGVPVSVMEAMAVGVPVIATNVGGTSELVDSETGILVRPADPESLAEAIVRMINDSEFRKRVSVLGRQKVETEFDVDKECKKLGTYLLESCSRAVLRKSDHLVEQ